MIAADLPPLQAGMVRVRFAAGGICGSDLHYFRHARTGDFIVTSPLVLGHEMAGVVDEVGEGVHGLAPGAKVAVNPSRWCGHCPRCREGRANLCENIYFMGSASKTPHMQGGFASLFDVTPPQCVPVPDDAPLAAVALAEPLAVCLHAVARAGELAGRHALLIGAGPIGLLTMLAARRAGVEADLWREIVGTIDAAPFEEVGGNWVRTHGTAHARRWHEMVQVAELLQGLGVDAPMTHGTVAVFERSTRAGLKDAFATPPAGHAEVIAALEQRLTASPSA